MKRKRKRNPKFMCTSFHTTQTSHQTSRQLCYSPGPLVIMTSKELRHALIAPTCPNLELVPIQTNPARSAGTTVGQSASIAHDVTKNLAKKLLRLLALTLNFSSPASLSTRAMSGPRCSMSAAATIDSAKSCAEMVPSLRQS